MEIKITFVVLLIIFKSFALNSSKNLFIVLVDNFFFVPYYVSLKNKNITVF